MFWTLVLRLEMISAMLLFIDFWKESSWKLFLKLIHYGSDNRALKCISNNFQARFQTAKFDTKNTPLMYFNHGVPQGSALALYLF